MKLLRIPRTVYSVVVDGVQYKEMYFGNLISSTATEYTVQTYDPAQEYSFMDRVYIPELHTVYTAEVDNPRGHPSVSRGWFKEGDNKHRMIDHRFSTKSVFEDECVVEFETVGMTHILGRGIENAKEVRLEYFDYAGNYLDTSFDCDTCSEVEAIVTMTYDDEFDCFSCCNPDPIREDSFFIPLDEGFCEDMYKVRITITKDDASKPILVSSMCVADAYDFGCVQKGFKIGDKIPSKITEFSEIQASGIEYANITTYMRGDILITADTVDHHRRAKKKYGGYLNYYLFDDLDVIKSGLVLGIAPETEYTINGENHTIMSFEAVGTDH